MRAHIVNSAKTLRGTLDSARGLPRLLRSRWGSQVAILTYHGVVRKRLPVNDWCFLDDSSFRRQIEYISRRFAVVTLSAAIEILQHGVVDKPIAVVTFDDGYQNNFDVAFPVLQQHRIPATIFLTTGFVDSSDTLWFCHIIHALSCTRKTSMRWENADLDLSAPRRKAAASARLQAFVKERSPAEISSLLRQIYEELDVDPVSSFEPESPFRMLSGGSIRTMAQSGLVEFGAHTVTHPILSLLSPGDQWSEISGSVDAVERLTGQPCRFFAYPNGQPQDYDSKTVELLRKRGISAAVTTTVGPNGARTSLMELQRYSIGEDFGMPLFQSLAHRFMGHLRN